MPMLSESQALCYSYQAIQIKCLFSHRPPSRDSGSVGRAEANGEKESAAEIWVQVACSRLSDSWGRTKNRVSDKNEGETKTITSVFSLFYFFFFSYRSLAVTPPPPSEGLEQVRV